MEAIARLDGGHLASKLKRQHASNGRPRKRRSDEAFAVIIAVAYNRADEEGEVVFSVELR